MIAVVVSAFAKNTSNTISKRSPDTATVEVQMEAVTFRQLLAGREIVAELRRPRAFVLQETRTQPTLTELEFWTRGHGIESN